MVCPRTQTKRVAEVVAVDGAIEDLEPDDAVRAEVLDGFGREGALVVTTSEGKTALVLADTFMNVPHMKGGEGFFYRLLGASGGPKVHPVMKWMSKKKKLRAHLARLAEVPNLFCVVPGHGDAIVDAPRDVLRAAVARM